LSNADLPTVGPAEGDADIAAVRRLLLDYGRMPEFALCFDRFDRELAGLPGPCAPPSGALLLAILGDDPVGTVGLCPNDAHRAEMKRLYVRPDRRGHGLGRRLAEAAIAAARSAGYRTILLETLPVMTAARDLYRSLGFVEIPASADASPDGIIRLQKDV
jgi:putative acetyltransferase